MKKDYLISIVMPVYNSEKTIMNTVNSILEQTYRKLELIIVDDGSEDKTCQLLQTIKDERVFVFKEENKGPSTARNYGIKVAKGDFIVFCDSDDIFKRNILEKFIKLINKKYYDIVLFKTIRIKENKKQLNKNDMVSRELNTKDLKLMDKAIYNKFCWNDQIFGFDATWGKFVSRQYLLKNNIYFPEGIFRFEDARFCKELYKHINKAYYLNEEGYYYIQNKESLCNKFNRNAVEMFYEALKVLGKNEYNKNDFYIKCITTLTECEKLYFFNKKYNKKYMLLKKEYYEMLKKEYYKYAIEKIDFSTIPLHYKVEIKLLKKRFFLIYMILKKVYMEYKKKI